MISLFRRDDTCKEALDRAFAEIRHLTDTIAEMKREGFNPPVHMEPMSDEGLGLPEVVADAIEQRAFNRQAREKLYQEARRMLRDGSPAEVADVILAGESSFSWGA